MKITLSKTPPTDETRQKFYLLMAGLGATMNLLDDIKDTPYYKGKLKKVLNNSYREIDDLLREVADKKSIDTNKLDPAEVWEQMNDSFTYFESWLNVLWDIPVENHEIFNNYVKARALNSTLYDSSSF
jgi:hypothetical protein